MLIYFYNILGMIMLIWYSCLRWKLLGNTIGKMIITDQHTNLFVLNWWYVPINFLTAIGSIYFLARTIGFLDKSYTDNMWILIFLLILRNIWYTFEDIQDYKTAPSPKQFIFILLDIAMVIQCAIWFYLYYRKS